MLQNGNIPQKQFAALNLDTINSQTEASILVKNLVGQDGKIREAVSLKINEYSSINRTRKLFLDKAIYNILLQGIIDVNGNVCRNIISAVCNLKTDKEFCVYFTSILIEFIQNLLPEIETFEETDGKYKVNKEFFKLYWALETLYEFTDYTNTADLKNILHKTKDCTEYTIREKTAKILSIDFDDTSLSLARAQLKNDPNYYVRRI